ncbi:MAG: dicarboxylate/amino acid:cation symporter [Phycisphaeraceae bacterium]|nr:dicarboxylate/amino acid:cation symporter [Phycisphaeraceae bacterium]
MRGGNLLTVLILLGLVAGVLFGQYVLFNAGDPIPYDHWTKAAGDLVLIRPLMLLIVPLIFVSVVAGVTAIGDPSRLGVVGGSTLVYYIATMLIAVTLGATLVSLIRPGDLPDADRQRLTADAAQAYAESGPIAQNIDAAQARGQDRLGGAWMNILEQIIPTNIVDEAAKGRPLALIVGGILFGLGIAVGGRRTQPLVIFFDAAFAALMRIVLWIIWMTPVGVFLLVAWTVGRIGFSALVGPISMYAVTVVAGLALHGLIVLPLVLLLFGRANPLRFLWAMRRALLTAFGTDSSSATLPVTIECAVDEGGVSKRSANFVLPLGSTVNMDGTALYEAVAVVFLFQIYGIDLGLTELLVVVITATLAAIGAAGIPSAGLVTMVIVITAVNRSLAGQNIDPLPVAAIGIIIGIDRALDMCRTVVNVWGDAVGAKIITRIAPDPVPGPDLRPPG